MSVNRVKADGTLQKIAGNGGGQGVPTGGTTGQALVKKSDTDYDTEWKSVGGGGGSSDYSDLSNKPQINGITLTGNKTAQDLNLVTSEVGKGLSTNDYTNADKTKLDGIDMTDYYTKSEVDAKTTSAFVPGGSVAFADLPALSASVLGKVYNVTDAFTTTADFVEGAGKSIEAGTNVAVINTGTDADPVYKYDASSVMIDTSTLLHKDGSVAADYLTIGVRDANKTIGNRSLSVGTQNGVSGAVSAAIGSYNAITQRCSLAVGENNTVSSLDSTAIGDNNNISSSYCLANGLYCTASAQDAHAEGNHTTASGAHSHAEGSYTEATTQSSHAEGEYSKANGVGSHAEGSHTIAGYSYQTVVGKYNSNNSSTLFEVGNGSNTSNRSNALEVYSNGNVNIKGNCTALGSLTAGSRAASSATGLNSAAVGINITASGSYSFANGNGNIASGPLSHAEGDATSATGNSSHSEGNNTTASGTGSHAEGDSTVASGSCSHAEGRNTEAYQAFSHTEGIGTYSTQMYQTVVGKYNTKQDTAGLFIVGNGTDDENRSDGMVVDTNGNVDISGTYRVNGNLFLRGAKRIEISNTQPTEADVLWLNPSTGTFTVTT